MHELSLIQGLLDMIAASAQAQAQGIAKVTRVHLVVGESHGALPEALDFAFGALSRDTVCAGAVREVENRPVCFSCRDCGREYAPYDWPYAHCPACGSLQADMVQGNELYIEYYEGE